MGVPEKKIMSWIAKADGTVNIAEKTGAACGKLVSETDTIRLVVSAQFKPLQYKGPGKPPNLRY